MLFDLLDTTTADRWLPPRLARALAFLRTGDPAGLATGRHELDGDRLFALVQDYTTRPPDRCVWEAHRKYIDVQFVARGVERMGYLPLADAREREAYDAVRDVAFFEPGGDYLTARAGMFAIFWPDDVHAPSGMAGAPTDVRKIVIKAAVAD